jgi:hypothetical protein
MARVPNMPRIPLKAIIGGTGAIAAASTAGYFLYNSVYSGAWRRARTVARARVCAGLCCAAGRAQPLGRRGAATTSE